MKNYIRIFLVVLMFAVVLTNCENKKKGGGGAELALLLLNQPKEDNSSKCRLGILSFDGVDLSESGVRLITFRLSENNEGGRVAGVRGSGLVAGDIIEFLNLPPGIGIPTNVYVKRGSDCNFSSTYIDDHVSANGITGPINHGEGRITFTVDVSGDYSFLPSTSGADFTSATARIIR